MTMSQTQYVSIPASHFIGNGELPCLIVGRTSNQDVDTALLILADSLVEADKIFVEALHSAAGNSEDARAELVAEHGSDHSIAERTILS
jgi:hypothetical protein